MSEQDRGHSELKRTLFGLNPHELLAPLPPPPPNGGELFRSWIPPTAEELAPHFPQLESLTWVYRGGMSAVYRAIQPALDRPVALKLLPAEAAADPLFAERFRTEARALAQLEHPHIVSIYDSGQTVSGHLYILMEFLTGGTLADLLTAGPLRQEKAMEIACAVCDALAIAHDAHIIHRDIKPSNILLTATGTVKVADFGLARLSGGPADIPSDLTVSGVAVGTPDYMSPEQRAGRTVDSRTDLYSLGVIVYEMLTGMLPFGNWRPPSRLAPCTRRADVAVRAALQADPADRVASARDFRTLLDRAANTRALPSRRHLMAGAGLGVAVMGAVGWRWRLWPGSFPADSTPPDPPDSDPSPRGTLSLSPAGSYHPLADLQLPTAAVSGHWFWQDEKPGDVLVVGYTHEQPSLKILHLPVRPGARSYDMAFDVWFDHRGGNLTFVLPAGGSHAALVLDMYDRSGIEMIKGLDWKTNETTVPRHLPYSRFLPVSLSVRPEGQRLAINVDMEGQPFIRWEGPQEDLSLAAEHYPPTQMKPRETGIISLFTLYGAARLRSLRLTIHP